jgi:hypothetical protein
MKFLNSNHKYEYNNLIKRAGIHVRDVERKALFYIISGNSDLLLKVSSIYDFVDNYIKPDCFRNTDFSSGTRCLVMLAFNLYSFTNKVDVTDAFISLDAENKLLALEAIRLRFNINAG